MKKEKQLRFYSKKDEKALEAAVRTIWGTRCPDYCAGCGVCVAWACADFILGKRNRPPTARP